MTDKPGRWGKRKSCPDGLSQEKKKKKRTFLENLKKRGGGGEEGIRLVWKALLDYSVLSSPMISEAGILLAPSLAFVSPFSSLTSVSYPTFEIP